MQACHPLFIAVLLAASAMHCGVLAQQPDRGAAPQAIERVELQRFAVPGTNYETIIARLEAGPNAQIGRHTHPGIESGVVLEGEMVLIIQGAPDRNLQAGDSYQIAPGVIHAGRSGPRGARVIAAFVVEKGKPFAIPVLATNPSAVHGTAAVSKSVPAPVRAGLERPGG